MKIRTLSVKLLIASIMSIITLAFTGPIIPQTTVIDTVVTVNTRSVVNPDLKGMGVQWSPYWPGENYDTVMSRIAYLQPQFIRCMVESYWYTKSDFEGNPWFIDGKPYYDFDSNEMKLAYWILDYCQTNDIQVIWGDWLNNFGDLIDYDDPRWAQIIAGCLHHLINVKGYTCIRYFNYGNEPDGSWSNNKNFLSYETGVKQLKAELDNLGVGGKVKISGPSSFYESMKWMKLSAAKLSRQMGSYDVHWYPLSTDLIKGGVEKLMTKKRTLINGLDPQGRSKDFFIGETGLFDDRDNNCDMQPNVTKFRYGVWMADYGAQVMRAGMSGVSAWDLDDAMYGSQCNPPDPNKKYRLWGFWNSGDETYGGMTLRPWFYTWSLMTRLFPRGSQIVSTKHAELAGFRTVAMKKSHGPGYDLTFMIVNHSDSARTITLKVPKAGSTATLKQFNYFDQDRPVDGQGFPVVKHTLSSVDLVNGVEVNLPPQGVIFLTTMYGGTPIPLRN